MEQPGFIPPGSWDAYDRDLTAFNIQQRQYDEKFRDFTGRDPTGDPERDQAIIEDAVQRYDGGSLGDMGEAASLEQNRKYRDWQDQQAGEASIAMDANSLVLSITPENFDSVRSQLPDTMYLDTGEEVDTDWYLRRRDDTKDTHFTPDDYEWDSQAGVWVPSTTAAGESSERQTESLDHLKEGFRQGAVTFEKPQDVVQIAPMRHTETFNPETGQFQYTPLPGEQERIQQEIDAAEQEGKSYHIPERDRMDLARGAAGLVPLVGLGLALKPARQGVNPITELRPA